MSRCYNCKPKVCFKPWLWKFVPIMCATSEDSDVSELLAHEKSPKLFKLRVKQVLYMHAHLSSLKIKFDLAIK